MGKKKNENSEFSYCLVFHDTHSRILKADKSLSAITTLILALLLIGVLTSRTVFCKGVKASLIVHDNCVGKLWF